MDWRGHMKIRTDFVTNSSSSGFIVSFLNSSEYEDAIASLPAEYRKQVVEDIQENQISRKAALEYARREFETDIEAESHLRNFMRKSQQKALLESKMELLEKSIPENAYKIAILEYEDHTDMGNNLENIVMPDFKGTKAVFRRH